MCSNTLRLLTCAFTCHFGTIDILYGCVRAICDMDDDAANIRVLASSFIIKSPSNAGIGFLASPDLVDGALEF